MNYGNRILIMGGSCAGKSTTAERLGKKLGAPVMFMDLYDPYAVPCVMGEKSRCGTPLRKQLPNPNGLSKVCINGTRLKNV